MYGNSQENAQLSLLNYIETSIRNALLEEVYTTPKPGLVDQYDTGAHTDMDCRLFEKSAAAIAPYLKQMFYTGMEWQQTPSDLFCAIRKTGICAEKSMFRATDGVNTHKGAIFTIGILSASAGKMYAEYGYFPISRILQYTSEMTNEVVEKEFCRMEKREPSTYGEKIYREYGERGVRGQAQLGFPVLALTAYPNLSYSRRHGYDLNKSNINTLLCTIVELNDTNVLARGSHNDLNWLKHKAVMSLKRGGAFTASGMEQLVQMNQECIWRNISPGGSADILAAAIFLWKLEQLNEELKDENQH